MITIRAPAPVSQIAPCAPVPPVELTTFIGRTRELEELERLLRAGRLLTLTGAGGSGKTRLGRELTARTAASFRDGTAWVELAPLSDPELLPQQVAVGLGIREDGARSMTDTLRSALAPRSMLLVLDNCEHLADACAAFVDTLLRDCAGLRVLATSREALGVPGERAWLVPPLSMPAFGSSASARQLAAYEAVELFSTRARDVHPSFRLTDENAAAVARICQRLDGLPLAIELAAARVRVLTPEQISQRLDNVFALLTSSSRTALPRHRTLRATIDWSYQLLSAPEQIMLQRLSVFAGGCTIDAAESVCGGDGLETDQVLDLIAGLVDRSLVTMREHEGHARYSLLEIMRQYGEERLVVDPVADSAARRRHASYLADIAEAALPQIERINSAATLARLRVEQDNLRAALHWSLTGHNDLQLALRLVAALWRYWFHANQWSEGAAWTEAMVAAVPTREPSAAWVRALSGAGVLAYLGRDAATCRIRLEEAEAMSRALDDGELLALTLYRLAHLFCDLGDIAGAAVRADEAVRLARASGQPWVLAEVLVYGVAFVHRMQGQLDLADAALAEAQEIALAADARMASAEAFIGRGMLALQRGHIPEALRHGVAAVRAAHRLGDHWYLSRALLIAAAAAVRARQAERAAVLLGCGTALREAAGTQVFPHEQSFYQEVVSEVKRALGDAEYARRWSEGSALRVEELDELLGDVAEVQLPLAGEERADTRVAATPAQTAHADGARSEAPALRVSALGPLEIHRHGEPLGPDVFSYAKPKELLVCLMLHPTGRTREQLGNALWPGTSAAQMKNSFHVTLHHLRKALGAADWIVIEGDRYRISPTISHELDASVFERDARRALKDVAAGLDELRRLLALYRGDLMEGEVAGPWLDEHRDRLHQLSVEVMLALGAALEAGEEHADAAELYHVLVSREDLNEEAHRRLMHAWARTGQRPRALRHYERLLTLLRDELGAEPEAETVDLYERLRRPESPS